MKCKAGQICRVVAPDSVNRDRLVLTEKLNDRFHTSVSPMWECVALQTITAKRVLGAGPDGVVRMSDWQDYPPGSQVLMLDCNLEPLGDRGQEEGDLFGVPLKYVEPHPAYYGAGLRDLLPPKTQKENTR